MILGDVLALIVLGVAVFVFLRYGCLDADPTWSPSPDQHTAKPESSPPPSHGGSQGETRRASSTGGPGARRPERGAS